MAGLEDLSDDILHLVVEHVSTVQRHGIVAWLTWGSFVMSVCLSCINFASSQNGSSSLQTLYCARLLFWEKTVRVRSKPRSASLSDCLIRAMMPVAMFVT